jgi:hypothetical protein
MPDITIITSLQQQWDLQMQDAITEEELLHMLADRIAVLLDRDAETFFQLMYKLDIPEQKLHDAFNTANPPQIIAVLVYQRQLQKMESRKHFRESNGGDDDMRW